MGRIGLLLLAIFGFTSAARGEEAHKTYDAVVAGMRCKQNSMNSLECDYRVGRSLHFIIAGVGDDDAGISFFASSFEGDYYAGFGILHRCITISPGEGSKGFLVDMAFVSPRDGKVYRDWVKCGQSSRASETKR